MSMVETGGRRLPTHPLYATAFFAVVAVLFSLGAAYDLRHHADAWRWFGVTVGAGIVFGAVAGARGRVAEDTSVRGAMRRTTPWIAWSTGASLILLAAGPVVGGIATGFAVGTALAMVVVSLRWWATARRS